MLSKCANPDCSTRLHYLRDGKVFQVEMSRPVPIDTRAPLRRVEHFWLCGPCSETQTLTYDQEFGVRILAKTPPRMQPIAVPIDAPPLNVQPISGQPLAVRRAAAS